MVRCSWVSVSLGSWAGVLGLYLGFTYQTEVFGAVKDERVGGCVCHDVYSMESSR